MRQCERSLLLQPHVGRSRKRFLAVFAFSALLAVGIVATFSYRNVGPISTLAKFTGTHRARVGYLAAKREPVVYYYVPQALAKQGGSIQALEDEDAAADEGADEAGEDASESGSASGSESGSASGSESGSASGSASGSGSELENLDPAKFACTIDNLKDLHALVQQEWDKCIESSDYKEPNAEGAGEGGAASASEGGSASGSEGGDSASGSEGGSASGSESGEEGAEEADEPAARRLLGWVWRPHKGEEKTRMPRFNPDHYSVELRRGRQGLRGGSIQALEDEDAAADDAAADDAAADDAAADEESGSASGSESGSASGSESGSASGSESGSASASGAGTLKECETAATEKACAAMSGCADPVCENYYNQPEVEALCGMCVMASGCFAHSAEVYVEGKGAMKVSGLEVGDRVLASSSEGKPISSEVIFKHDHKEASITMQIHVAQDVMELTPAHMVATYTQSCGVGYCSDAKLVPAKDIRAGDKVYVSDGSVTGVNVVTKVTKAMSQVRYVITSDDNFVVNGVVAPVYSTSAKSLETLPFHLLHQLAPGALQWEPIAAALELILESPFLKAVESVVNAIAGVQSPKDSVPTARFLAAAHLSH